MKTRKPERVQMNRCCFRSLRTSWKRDPRGKELQGGATTSPWDSLDAQHQLLVVSGRSEP
jgi:hypothetical protein